MYLRIACAACAALWLPLTACAADSSHLSGFLAGEPKPPRIAPFEIPVFDGEKRDFRGYIPPLVPTPPIDAEGIYQAIINCYPNRSLWRIDVDLVGGYRTDGARGIGIDDTALGGHYVGVVARMPLYSATEMDRQREREYRRRVETAKIIGDLVQAIARRNTAHRGLGLYTALEARSQERVLRGITEASEQVGYMEKVVSAYESVALHSATITEKRLALLGMCREEAVPALDQYLRAITELPKLKPEAVPVTDERMAAQ